MSYVLDLSEQLQKSQAELVILERALIQRPNDKAVRLMVRSMEKHCHELQEEYVRVAEQSAIDVCGYRIFKPGLIGAASVCSAIAEFQRLFSITYSAVKSGPRQRYVVPSQDEKDTTFGFSFSFAGSVGIMLNLPNEGRLLSDPVIDESMGLLFDMARLSQSDAIKAYAKRLGIAVIRELHKWSTVHSASGLGAEIRWKAASYGERTLLVQPQELKALSHAIDATSDETAEELDLEGVMLGADVGSRKFHFRGDDGTEIRGDFFDAISEQRRVQLPTRYRALIRKTETVRYSTEEPSTRYFLESITPP